MTARKQLIEAIFDEERWLQAERWFSLDAHDDVALVLNRVGRSLVHILSEPIAIARLRVAISVSARLPEMSKKFYEAGPAFGIARLARYFQDQNAAGILAIPDCEVAAAQFLDTCHATLLMPLLLCLIDQPTEEVINYVVGLAVRAFLRQIKFDDVRARHRRGQAALRNKEAVGDCRRLVSLPSR